MLVFSFTYSNGYVFEVKHENPKSDKKSDKYQWIIYDHEQIYKLNFNKMDQTVRYFDDDIQIDTNGKMVFLGKSYDLITCTDKEKDHIIKNIVPLIYL